MNKCPSTKTGKPLIGMLSADVLVDLDRDIPFDKLAPALAAAVAEIFNGYVTHVDHNQASGFYFLSKSDESRFISFKDVLVKSFWMERFVCADSIDTDLQNMNVSMRFFVTGTPVVYSAKTSNKNLSLVQLELINILKCLVQAHRSGAHTTAQVAMAV